MLKANFNNAQSQKRSASYDKFTIFQHNRPVQKDKQLLLTTKRVGQKCHPQKGKHDRQQLKTTRSTQFTSRQDVCVHSSSNPQLTSIPLLQNPQLIVSLNYSFNKICTIPKEISFSYQNLTKLDLSHNQISQILPICYLTKLIDLNLGHNLINQIPKQIKKLKDLSVLDLSFNKLWYLTQIVTLKELINLKDQQKIQCFFLSLQGNSVLKTNETAVQKLIGLKTKTFPQRKTQNVRNIIRVFQQNQNKQNICPKNGSNRQAVYKHNKSKSISQSLLEISAIIAQVPINSQKKDQQVGKNPQIPKTKSPQTNNASPQKSLQIGLEANPLSCQKSDTLLFNSPNFISNQIEQIEAKKSKATSIKHLFKQVQNFQEQYLHSAAKLYKQINQIDKKIKIIQTIQQIQENIKPSFLDINTLVLNRIRMTLEILSPFLNFFDQQNTAFQNSNFIKQNQIKINKVGGLDTVIQKFHIKSLQTFINMENIVEITWYEVWIHQIQQFKKLFANVSTLIKSYILLWKKIQKISGLSLVLQSNHQFDVQNTKKWTDDVKKNIFASKNVSEKKQLKNLLFSQNKQQKTSLYGSQKKDSQLLSRTESKSNGYSKFKHQTTDSQKQNNKCCLQCPVKAQQILILNQTIRQSQQKQKSSQEKIQQLQQLVSDLTQQNAFCQKVRTHQREIQEELAQLKPSTYQNILLEQAKSIQEFMNAQNYISYKKIAKTKKSKNLNKQVEDTSTEKNRRTFQKFTKSKEEFQFQQSSDMSIKPMHEFGKNISKQTYKRKDDSKHKEKSQRTYFKSNGTAPFSISTARQGKKCFDKSIQVQRLCSENQNSQKNRLTTERYGINDFVSNQKIYKKTVNPKTNQTQFDKNEIFQTITVEQWKYDQQCDIQKMKKNESKKSFTQNKQKILNAQEKQLNRIGQKISQNLTRANLYKNSLSKKSNNPKIYSKTDVDIQTESDTANSVPARSYDYKELQLEQKIDFKNYMRFHLRNNIIQLLQRRNFEESIKNHDKTQSSRAKYENYTKASLPYSKCIPSKKSRSSTQIKSICKILESEQQKQVKNGKYIKKSGDTHGK